MTQPGESVEKRSYASFVYKSPVTDNHSTDVYGQITVAVEQVREGKDKKYQCQQKYRIERFILDVDFIQYENCQATEQVAAYGADCIIWINRMVSR